MRDSLKPDLEFALEIRLTLKKPRLELNGLPRGGNRLSVQIEQGEFEGPLLKGKILPGGGEWPHIRTDDVFCFDARYHLQEDDGTIILIQNSGYRHASPEVQERLWALRPGDVVPPDAYYFRSMTRFETAPGKHDWLARHVFVGVGERLEKGNRLRYYKVV
ncbi:MAG: hypothetical protein CL535_10405 [Ahrensia sp.]|nr:hypothetical protein [Ahrensia sp.]|tara:strand:+ start:89756 stop:90238 length:483 start_codon:yes stop_codon:yes gene_type:complete